eukprot:CAMPEP_0185024118 /NCGR_PEP_ID=MMETSP1103-20130426/7042_1 /TAXON_ID=36769 /ORGANISM="Paraphysomonas bandaiensis, Strain Caron Lab Isolate" /LENGTH=207 /DNA_ID=CAMNT_0027556989 /DNA_START=182 /DNA_END=805 /DNA_ORIENTATION=+
MMMMSPSIKTEVRCGSCTRICTGETCCKTVYTNKGDTNGFVSLTPNYPAKVIPLHLPNVGGKFIAKKGAYMSSIGDVGISADMDCNPATCCCGGLGCIRQAASGQGTVFYAAGGTILQKTLKPGERVIVDALSIVGFQESVTFGVKPTGGCGGMCCGGEGLCYGTLTGPGEIIVQSMSFEKFKAAVAPPVQGGSEANDGAQPGEASG